MKYFWICVVSVCCFFYGTAADVIYYTPVDMPAFLRPTYQGMFDMKLIAEDLASLLKKSTGKNFTTKPFDKESEGIILLLNPGYQHISNEAGTVEYKKNSIIITAKYSTGISYAVYSWLHELGFSFGLPGDNWISFPGKKSLALPKTSYTFYPKFKLRTIYASGGMPAVKGLDENNSNQQQWWLWHRRNRMGSDYVKIDGHIGELFNITHQKQITEDPMILAPVDGKRKYDIGGKLDPTYKKGVRLFIEWIKEQFNNEKNSWPSFLPPKKYYSVDPGDGLNYCHTQECEMQFRSVSDQVFSIANAAADEMGKNYGVSTMAYTERADTPSIAINDNVHVMVVPTAFQSVSTSTELMQRWRKKTRNISQYDFLNIGAWNYDQPFFNIGNYVSRLQFLDSLQIEGMSFEASMSKFSSGIQQYFILNYLCDPYGSADSLLENFCNKYFESASAPIQQLFREWYFSDVHLNTNRDRESFYPDELSQFARLINKADSLASTNEVKHRIEELKIYFVYLCIFYELATTKQNASLADSLLHHIWKHHNSLIFHSTQLSELISRSTANPGSWNYSKANFSTFSDRKNSAKHEFESTSARYQFKPYSFGKAESLFQSLLINAPGKIQIRSMDEQAFGKFIYPISFYSSRPSLLTINFKTGIAGKKNQQGQNAVIAVESNDMKFVSTHFVISENTKGSKQFHIPRPGFYKLYLGYFNETPVSFDIVTSEQLFYYDKKSLLMNGMHLYEESPNPGDAAIAFIANSDSVKGFYPYETSIIPLKIFSNGQRFQLHRKGNVLSASKDTNSEVAIIFNDVYRWPYVLMETRPVFFYQKNSTNK